jgi:hypothetical protein
MFYPFGAAEKVKLVSFRFHRNNYPVRRDSLLVDSLIETRTLTKNQLIKLTDILYNNIYRAQPNYGVTTLCFFPRNAILFFDRTGKLIEYINICFHCDNYGSSSDKIWLGDNCEQKMDKLRKFFVSAGVLFGTDPHIDQYLGEMLGDEGLEVP